MVVSMFIVIPISICVDLLPGHTYEDLLVGPKLILAYILHRSLLYTNSNCYTETNCRSIHVARDNLCGHRSDNLTALKPGCVQLAFFEIEGRSLRGTSVFVDSTYSTGSNIASGYSGYADWSRYKSHGELCCFHTSQAYGGSVNISSLR